MESSERSKSIWKVDVAPIEAPSLEEDKTADVCVVGAGIAGMTAAYLLARGGAKVIVLERGLLGGGETAQTTAHLAGALDERFSWLEQIHGREKAKLAYESHAEAIDQIEEIVNHEGIACDFERVDGYLFLGREQPIDLLERKLEAASRVGFEGVARLARAPLPFFDTGPCLRFPRQGMFHPLRYLSGLIAAARRNGALVYAGTQVVSVDGGRAVELLTQGGARVHARSAIVATNTPMSERFAMHTKQAPYRTFAVGFVVPEGSVPRALYRDTEEPDHYLRLQSVTREDGSRAELLIVGGERHKTGEADDAEERYARLEAWTRARFPMVERVMLRWSEQVMEPIDGLAFIGEDPERARNVYIATGDAGQGMTHGTIAGMLLRDAIAGRKNRFAELYSPTRKPILVARESLKVVGHDGEWLRGDKVKRVDEIARGKDSALPRARHKVAVYRDDDGEVVEQSAVCTHPGCIVHWNSEEQSWDCPSHGSRFAPTGEVLMGPAAKALGEPAEASEEPPKKRLRKAS